jgi:ubiquinone/menaquinone biosynthesis C-methylase UbiE
MAGNLIDQQMFTPRSVANCVSVEAGYKRWAATYDQTPNPILALEERYLLPLLPSIAGKHVLDLACGTGRWLEVLLEAKAAHGIGIDLSPAMLDVARQKAAIAGRLGIADCLELPFKQSAFDLAICSFALEHIANLSAAAAEWSRVLKPPGDLYISQLHPAAHTGGWRVGFRDRWGAMQIEAAPHSSKEIIATFIGAGFELERALECFIGEPERSLFVSAGKNRIFDAASKMPAIVIMHFRRVRLASINLRPDFQEKIGNA